MAPKMRAEWFWVDRWMTSRAWMLPMEARGLYREMLSQAWVRGGVLPSDEDALMRAVGATSKEWKRSWPLVAPFWNRSEDGLTISNATQLSVMTDCQAISEKRSKIGAKGAASKHQKSRQACGNEPCKRLANGLANASAKTWPPDTGCRIPDNAAAEGEGVASSSGARASPPPPYDPGHGHDPDAAEPKPFGPPPINSVADAWAEACPDLPQPSRPLSGHLRTVLARAVTAEPDRDWPATFARVARSAFLTGRGRKQFRAALTWVVKPENLAKLDGGEFDERQEDRHAPNRGDALADTVESVGRDMLARQFGEHAHALPH